MEFETSLQNLKNEVDVRNWAVKSLINLAGAVDKKDKTKIGMLRTEFFNGADYVSTIFNMSLNPYITIAEQILNKVK